MTKDSCPHCGAVAQPGVARCATCGAWLGETPTLGSAYSADSGVSTPPATTSPTPATQTSATPQAQPVYPANTTGYSAYPAATGAPGAPTQPAYPAYPAYSGYPAYPAYPTYPAYPPNQGVAPGVYPYPAGSNAPYGYAPTYGGYVYSPYGYYMPAYGGYAYPAKPRRAPGEVYALVIAWIVTALAGISVIGGALISLLSLFALFGGQGDDLSFLGSILGFSLGPIFAGGFGLWYGIRGIMRRPSPRFQLPPAWVMLTLALAAIGGALALWSVNQGLGRAPGAAFGVLPLAMLTGALPALAILAFTTQRLGDPSSRRHVWVSLFYGMTLAPLLAVFFEGILALVIVAVLGLTGQDAQSVLSPSTSGQPSPQVALAMFLLLSVVAPLVEEGVKPLGALLAVRRLRTPGEMFLVGLAAGVGFDMFETIGYIGQGQADWVSVSIERIGAGLLHGVGAGMGALGWYYLINGKGVPLRWLRAAGAFLYAILQHGVFNGFSLAGQLLPASVNDWLSAPLYLGPLPLQRMDIIYLCVYAFILGVLIIMTSRLVGAKGMPQQPPRAPEWPAGGYPYAPYPAIPWGYGLAPAPAATAPMTAPMSQIAPPAQTAGGAQ